MKHALLDSLGAAGFWLLAFALPGLLLCLALCPARALCIVLERWLGHLAARATEDR